MPEATTSGRRETSLASAANRGLLWPVAMDDRARSTVRHLWQDERSRRDDDAASEEGDKTHHQKEDGALHDEEAWDERRPQGSTCRRAGCFTSSACLPRCHRPAAPEARP